MLCKTWIVLSDEYSAMDIPNRATANETRSLHAHRKVSVRYFTQHLFNGLRRLIAVEPFLKLIWIHLRRLHHFAESCLAVWLVGGFALMGTLSINRF